MTNRFPVYVDTPQTWQGQVATANSARDGSGTVATIFTAGTNGARIDVIRIQATVTTTDGMVRLFLHDGSAYKLLKEIVVPATTGSATVVEYATEWTPTTPISILTGWSLRATTANSEAINIFAFGGAY